MSTDAAKIVAGFNKPAKRSAPVAPPADMPAPAPTLNNHSRGLSNRGGLVKTDETRVLREAKVAENAEEINAAVREVEERMARIEERHAALLATVKERAVVPGEPKPRFFFFRISCLFRVRVALSRAALVVSAALPQVSHFTFLSCVNFKLIKLGAVLSRCASGTPPSCRTSWSSPRCG